VIKHGVSVHGYRIERVLGRGGMGVVYLAVDEELDGQQVALKIVARPHAGTAGIERLRKEVRLAQRVTHPGVCRIYDLENADDTWMIKMEYVAGETLAQRLRRGACAVPEILRIAREIVEALGAAHRQGVVHRDLKPQNVMIEADTGRVVLMDFGIAHQVEVTADTAEGAIGTPAYMAPEQVRAQRSDGRTDLYALGCVLYEMLVGDVPFPGKTPLAVSLRHIEEPAPDPRARRPQTPVWLARVVLALLEKDPGRRPADAAAALALLAGPRSRRRFWWNGVAAVAVIAIAIVAIATRGGDRGADGAPAPRDRPLTSSASLGSVSGSLSPDGATLALARDGRLMLQDTDSGEVRDLPSPGEIVSVAWFPGGDRLLLGVATGPTVIEQFAAPIDGTPARTLGIRAWGAAVSGDGTRLATYDEDGIRVTPLDGGPSRLLVGTRENAAFSWPAWSPDDRWITYGIMGPDLQPAIRAVAADGSADVLIVDDPTLAPPGGLLLPQWASSGRIVYTTYAAGGSALMGVDVDLATARPSSPPVRLATFLDQVGLENISRDGGSVLYARVQSATRPYRVALGAAAAEVRADEHPGWELIGTTPDGATRFYLAPSRKDRTDVLAIAATGDSRVLASIEGPLSDAQVTPDGSAILFLHAGALTRVAAAGGPPTVIESLPYEPGVPVQLACARTAGKPCVLGAIEGREQRFYEVDPAKGRGRRIAELRGAPPWSWDVSPDGERLVVAHRQDNVRIVDVASGEVREALADPQMVVHHVAWIGDTASFLMAGGHAAERQVVRVDPDGTTRTLWNSGTETVLQLRVAVDGAELYFLTGSWSRNFWLLDLP
jgi:predicted Ser/Thr protein kinase